MFWALDLDDFGGMESDTAYPLATAVRTALTTDGPVPVFRSPDNSSKKVGALINGYILKQTKVTHRGRGGWEPTKLQTIDEVTPHHENQRSTYLGPVS